MKKLLLLVVLLFASANPSQAQEAVARTDVPTAGKAALDAIIAEHKISVRMVTEQAPQWWPEWLTVGGWVAGERRSHLSDLSVAIDGKEVFMPRSAYEPLFVVHGAELRPSKNGFLLTVYGSESAEEYVADFMFDFEVMDLREFHLSQPTGYGDEERRIFEAGIWQCEREAKKTGNAC